MLSFRTLNRADLPRLRHWLNTPHVYEWWGRHSGPGSLGGAGDAAATEDEVEKKYGATIDHGGTTQRFIIEHKGAPIGLIQWYHLRDFADYARAINEDPNTCAGLDLLIGELNALGRGLGTQAIDRFVTTIIFHCSEVNRVVTGPAQTNARSIRAFEKAGFRFTRFTKIEGEAFAEAVLVRDR